MDLKKELCDFKRHKTGADTVLLQKNEVSSYEEVAFAKTEDLYRDFGTGPSGLSSQEAKLRLLKKGSNVLPTGKKSTIVSKIIIQLKNLFNVLLLVAAVLAFITASPQMGWAILAAVAINTLFSIYQEHRGERAAQVIKSLIPSKTKVIRDGEVKEIDVSDVVPGDILTLEEGNRVPADLRLTSAYEVSVNNSTLTGESEPQKRFAAMVSPVWTGDINDLQNILFAGTTVVSGVAEGIAIYTGKETQFGRIVSISREAKEPLSPLEKDISYTAKLTTYASLVIAAIFFTVAALFIHLDLADNILFAIGVATCMVPEGFQLTISLSLAITALAMAKRNVVVKRLSSVETIGSMTALCVDKTGTITSGEMMVKKVWASGWTFEVTGDGYNPKGVITLGGKEADWTDRPQILELLKTAAFCTNCKLDPPSDEIGRWTCLGDPTDGAFLVFAGKGETDELNFDVSEALVDNQRIHLIPFDSQRRIMTSVNGSPDESITAYTKGAGSDVLSRCTQILYTNDYIPLTEEMRKTIIKQMDDFASEGFRVLAMAFRVLPNEMGDSLQEVESQEIEKDMVFLGLVALFDPPRPKIETAVKEARSAGIKVFMLTGDHELTAYSIAKRVGIISSVGQKAVTGSELRQMSDEDLIETLKENGSVFARITPEQKLRIVQVLKSMGEVVAVTGDGVNDTPALIEAHVGIGMGAGGTDVARESASMVLLDNDFTSIIEGAKLGRATFDNLRNFVYYIYTHNFCEFLPFVLFVLLNIPLPLQVVQILAIDLGMDIMPGLSLIMEPPDPDVMTKPPRKKSAKLIDVPILLRSFYVGTTVSAGALLLCFSIWRNGGWTFGMSTVPDPMAYARGTTVVMAGVMFCQLGNIFTARTSSESAFKLNPLRNKWLLRAIPAIFVIMAAQVYIPVLQSVYQTAPLLPSDFLFLAALAPLALLLEETRKLLARQMLQQR